MGEAKQKLGLKLRTHAACWQMRPDAFIVPVKMCNNN
jgi:hypothetical protein